MVLLLSGFHMDIQVLPDTTMEMLFLGFVLAVEVVVQVGLR